ncbi:MAG TPA: RDD family protein [Longimicrobiales bacterium]|nr:RDD family protein [Longimicrobiales bacterium]
MPTNVRDPRSIITPDAFELDESLLGIPLARPGQRLVALLIDITVIGVLNVFTSGLGIFIWTIVGLFLVRMSFRTASHPHRQAQVTSTLYRGFTGCLGIIILGIVGLLALANMVSRDGDADMGISPAVAVRTISALGAFDDLRAELDDAESEDEAREVLAEALDILDDLDLEAGARAEALRALIPEDPGFTDDRDAFVASLVDSRDEDVADEGPEVASLPSEEQAAIDSLDAVDALERYAEGLAAGADPDQDPTQRALRTRVLQDVATDTLARLGDALAEERSDRARAERRAEGAVDELAERDSGFVALLRDIWDQAGSALGLWSIYFTVAMTLSNGFTVGKRLLGVRVIRLDGEPLTWWASFERAGGYVAGIATGLLGFAQIFWDPNRQCVHDKIGSTVVIIAGAPPEKGAVDATWKTGTVD